MKILDSVDANVHLHSVGMEIGEWNEIRDLAGRSTWISQSAPADARELLTFAQHIVTWVPNASWKILQIDNSAVFDSFQINFLNSLVRLPPGAVGFGSGRTFLFEFCGSETEDVETEFVLANLVFALLLFDAHGYVVSKNSLGGEKLGVQDGVAYFMARNSELTKATEIIETFNARPLASPDWITRHLNARLE